MIETLKAKLHYEYGPSWETLLEISETSTLVDLHNFIQNTIDFDNDHMFEFYLASSQRSYQKTVLYSYDKQNKVLIRDIFPLPKGRKLFYLFDYGDEWLFQISKSRKNTFLADKNVSYPRCINESGERPEQYPDYDDEG